jgi:predicted amidophosphoribosyltransferase
MMDNETPEVQQENIRPLLQELATKTMQLGQLTLGLYAQGELTHQAVNPLCDELLALEEKLTPQAAASASAEPVEAETAVAPSPEPTSTLTQCPQCQTAVVPGRKFCTNCGFNLSTVEAAPSVSTAPHDTQASPGPESPPSLSPAASPQALTPPVSGNCITCGATLQSDAAFCTNCGEPIASMTAQTEASFMPAAMPVTVPPSPVSDSQTVGPITQYCENCGKGVAAEITVCPECQGTQFDPA